MPVGGHFYWWKCRANDCFPLRIASRPDFLGESLPINRSHCGPAGGQGNQRRRRRDSAFSPSLCRGIRPVRRKGQVERSGYQKCSCKAQRIPLKGAPSQLAASRSFRLSVPSGLKGCSSVGRAAVSKTAGRRFKPGRPCHFQMIGAKLSAAELSGNGCRAKRRNFIEHCFPSCVKGKGCLCRSKQTRGAWG